MQVTRTGTKSKKAQAGAAPRRLARSSCAVANTLDLVGDKWSLLVVRDLFRGSLTYGELQDSFEGIPTNILADRLKKLEAEGIIAKSPYQQRPVRYSYALTEKGRALGDVLLAIVRWGQKHIPGTEALGSPTLNSPGGGKLSGK
jgi:DNA-binding HxlR family transcriptional regulator